MQETKLYLHQSAAEKSAVTFICATLCVIPPLVNVVVNVQLVTKQPSHHLLLLKVINSRSSAVHYSVKTNKGLDLDRVAEENICMENHYF